MTVTELLHRDHAWARSKLGQQVPGTRKHDYYQGVYDALNNLLGEAKQHGALS